MKCNYPSKSYKEAKMFVDMELKSRRYGVLYQAVGTDVLTIASEALLRCIEESSKDEDCCMRHRGERTETNTDMVCGCKGD